MFFGRDTKSWWSLLSGVYARGCKRRGKCVNCSGLTNSREGHLLRYPKFGLFGGNQLRTLYGVSEGVIYSITFHNYIVVHSTDGKKTCVKMAVDKLDAMFIGAGDLFAALWIAWQDKHPDDLEVLKLLV